MAFWVHVAFDILLQNSVFNRRFEAVHNLRYGMLIQKMMSIVLSQLQDKTLTTVDSVGAFQKLPMVMPSVDVFYSALKKAKRVPPTKGN